MYIFQYKGQTKELLDMFTHSLLFKSLTSPKLVISTLFISFTNIPDIIEKYLFKDLGFAKWLVIVMCLDLITGITKVWVLEGLKNVTSKGLRDTVSKCIQYGAFLIITHVLTHFEVDGEVILGRWEWFQKLAFEFLIFIEIKSVYENITAINPRLDFITVVVDKGKEILNLLKTKK